MVIVALGLAACGSSGDSSVPSTSSGGELVVLSASEVTGGGPLFFDRPVTSVDPVALRTFVRGVNEAYRVAQNRLQRFELTQSELCPNEILYDSAGVMIGASASASCVSGVKRRMVLEESRLVGVRDDSVQRLVGALRASDPKADVSSWS